MSHRVRSIEGCWTCRLRKKKCDERRPTCSPCIALALPCHGYGSRPGWMDGREREREMADQIRQIVKMTAGKNRRAAMLRRQQTSQSVLADNSSGETSCAPVTSIMQPEDGRRNSLGPALATSPNGKPHDVADNGPTISAPDDSLLSLPFVSDDDQTSLLMHYLDHVFPLQFPFYKSSIRNGGRGWLLSILMQTKPLYHAALSLAAYHRQFEYSQGTTDIERCLQVEALQEKHVMAITVLRQFLQRISSNGQDRSIIENVQLLCCMVLLVSLEVSQNPSYNVFRS